MKKPGLIITETIFSLVLAASVAAVAVLAVDLKTNRFHLDRFNPFAGESSVSEEKGKDADQSKKNQNEEKREQSLTESSPDEASAVEVSADESSTKENSQPEASDETSGENSREESGTENHSQTIKLLAEPKNLKSQPKELDEMLKKHGYGFDNSIDGNRIIMIDTTAVEGEKTKAYVYCYQKSETSQYWWNVVGDNKPITQEAYIGENGSYFEPKRDSKITPGGIYQAGQGFYIGTKPSTTYSLFEITDKTYWVTDPKSKFYNQKVEGTDKKDWETADHMITSEKSYQYGLVIQYNTQNPNKDLAAAIFLHCGSAATEGSVAVPENVMKTILEWLNEDSRVTVFITI